MLAPVDHGLEPAVPQLYDDLTQQHRQEVSECRDVGLETSDADGDEASPPPLKSEFIQLTIELNGPHPLSPDTPSFKGSIPPPIPPPKWKTKCGLD